MLEHLTFSVTFRGTGRTIAADHEFAKGLTAIGGPNEAGKSLRLEMIRFALFGTKALRANKTEYKSLTADLKFKVSGVGYSVSRTLNNAKLRRGQEDLAVGAAPVTAKISSLLGFGIEVFDLTNNCLQGEVEKLTQARPAERKTIIEKAVGGDAIAQVISKVANMATAAAAHAKALRETLSPPGNRPSEPDWVQVQDPETLQDEIDRLNQRIAAGNRLLGRLQAKAMDKPKEPVAPKKPESIESLEDLRAEREKVQQLKAKLSAIMDELFRLPENALTEEEIRNEEQLISAWELWTRKERLLDEGTIECPECKSVFPHAHKALAAYEGVSRPEKPAPSAQSVSRDRATAAGFARRLALEPQVKILNESLAQLNPAALSLRISVLEQYQIAWSRHQGSLAQYQKHLVAWETDQKERSKAQKELKELELDRLLGEVKLFQAMWTEWTAYQSAMKAYDQAKAQYEKRLAGLVEKEKDADEWDAALKAMKQLKALIDTHLVPSLSHIASSYLSVMTAGARTSIRIDKDFEITVDGQSVETLSGSAKAVTNLAVRIALGLVLASKRFSVFMGDEIDASMDESRAASTAEALHNLTSVLDQIILVSHKQMEADHTISI